jgi:peroxiredoxin
MANLTGEYDVATEVGLGLVNCILAAIHENENEAYPRLLHSLTVRVNDVHRGPADPVPEAERTGIRTSAEVQVSTPTLSLPVEGLPDKILARARTPVTTAVQPGRGPVGPTGPIGPIGPGTQPTCWPRITARVGLRAWLRDTPEELPEFLHGNLHLTAGLARTDLIFPIPEHVPGIKTFLGLDHSAGPEVRFEAAAGTTVTQEQRVLVERILRNYMRSDIEPVSFKLELPTEVRRFDYKLQPTGPRPSAMLMFTLKDRPSGPQGPASVSARFLPSGADFAVAIGRDYLVGELRTQLLADVQPQYGVSGTVGFWPFETSFSASVQPDWDGATFDLQAGRIVFSVSGSGVTTVGPLPSDHWSFTIRQAITLGVVGGLLEPALAGDPEVELHDVAVGEGTIREEARKAIKNQLQSKLSPLPPDLRKALDVGRQLEKIIRALHPADPGVALTGVEIRPDGIVVPGTVALAPSSPVVVRQSGLNGRADALESWIPGGTIERFVWDSHVEEHRFVTEKPFAAVECLSVQGTRVTRGGGLAPVNVDDCPLLVAMLPVFTDVPTPPVPCRRPLLPLLAGAPEEGVEVVGHYDPWASGLVPPGGPTNLLVHFAEGPWVEAATVLDEALAATRKRDSALVLVGVLGRGGLAQAAGTALDADATVLLTEDPAGSWAAVFGISKAPATVLVGPDGDVRWKDEAPLDPRKLSKVLDEELEPGGEVSWRPLRLAVAASDRAPDAVLRLGEGRQLALRRLLGESVVLSFWTSCSEPSIEQLRQLREALESGRSDQPYVLGIGDGESSDQVTELAKREQLPFPLIPDPERLVARAYAVSSWPATVEVDREGRIVAADLGLHPGLSPCDRPGVLVARSREAVKKAD